MRLHTTTWGTGSRVAVLLHGLFGSTRAFDEVGPALAAQGYRAIAVDLPGHGHSPRAGSYSIESVGDAVLETVPGQPALAIGHSLGGLVLSRIVETLQPAAAIYSDPGLSVPQERTDQPEDSMAEVAALLSMTEEQLAAANPGMSVEQITADAAGYRRFDPAFMAAVGAPGALRAPSTPATVPSLVLRAEESWTVPDTMARDLVALGFDVRTIAGAGHGIDRDRPAEYLDAIQSFTGSPDAEARS